MQFVSYTQNNVRIQAKPVKTCLKKLYVIDENWEHKKWDLLESKMNKIKMLEKFYYSSLPLHQEHF